MSGEAHTEALIEVDNLHVSFFTRRGVVEAVRGASFSLGRGQTLGLVGESGSGKSVTARAIIGLVDLPGRIVSGDIRWKGESLRGKKGTAYANKIRGKAITIVFQDPMTSLNPLMKVGDQIGEVLRYHRGMDGSSARARAIELLDVVGISYPKQRVTQYPYEFSGGMNQRVAIAMALASEPELLIADEPTTALDVTIQAQILDLIKELQRDLGLAVLLITHDLAVVAGLCHKLAVMYAGQIVETGSSVDVYADPGHPYSWGLIGSTPRLDVVVPKLVSIAGSPPSLINPPVGCPYASRCQLAIERCELEPPELFEHLPDRKVACFRAFDIRDVGAPVAGSAG